MLLCLNTSSRYANGVSVQINNGHDFDLPNRVCAATRLAAVILFGWISKTT